MALVLLVVVGPLLDAAAAGGGGDRPPLRLPLRLARAGVRLRHRLPLALLHLRRRGGCGSWSARWRSPTSSSSARSPSSGSTWAASSSRTSSSDPHWPMWYLSALFFWRLCTPSSRPMSGLLALAVAVAVSLVGGHGRRTDTLDLASGSCGLLPFFVLGLMATPERLERLREPGPGTPPSSSSSPSRWRPPGPTSWSGRPSGSTTAHGYRELGVADDPCRADPRSALLPSARSARSAFLALVPRSRGWFTRMGAATLVVYLFHGFVIKGAEYAGYMGWADDHASRRVRPDHRRWPPGWPCSWPGRRSPACSATRSTRSAPPRSTCSTAVRLAEAPAQAEEIAEARRRRPWPRRPSRLARRCSRVGDR